MKTARKDVLDIFLHSLRTSRVEPAMQRRLRFGNGVMELDGHRYALGEFGRRMLVSVGKAGHTLASTFLAQAGDDAARFEGIIVGPVATQALPLPQNFRVYHGGHPSPNEASLAAATDILRTLESLAERDLVVFLISGGGSAMLEQFLQPGLTLATIAATHKALVESGAPITAMNAVRKHLSAVKGGRLAAAAAPAEQLTIFVSDVPPGELDALSSGSTLPDRSTVEDVYRIAQEYGLDGRFPGEIAEMLTARTLVETPKTGDAIFARSRWSVLLDSASLEEAAAVRAAELGWFVEIDNRCDDWSAEQAATYLLGRLEELRRTHERVCLLSAGEITVRVPPEASGKGGRNQHFALLCSEQIAGQDITVLSGGSDGIDGNSPAAGAVVDGTTTERAALAGYPVAQALDVFDSYSLLMLLGDTIMTGPTGNNLRDLRILLSD
ncbi:MAG: glycerate 2-kinase [Edaphobacter sp.]|nr:glycerate 2-kinase [Edaphobacter sp.]